MPNLTDQTLDRLRFYDLQLIGRDAVLIMPRHLTSLRPFREFQTRICSYVESTISNPVAIKRLERLPVPDRLRNEIAM